jgi:hypothetical protein
MQTLTLRPLLTPEEQTRRDQLDALIEQHVSGFAQTAIALSEVKRDQLWRSTHDSFEHYCEDKFDKCRSHGYQLAAVGEALANLSDVSDAPLPGSFRQARPLTKLTDATQQDAAWQAALTISNDNPTEADVARAVVAVQSQPSPQFTPGQVLTVQVGEFAGQIVTVDSTQGVIVHCTNEAGKPVALLTTEIAPLEPPKPRSQNPKPHPSTQLIQGLGAKAEVLQARVTLLESLLNEAVPYLPAALLQCVNNVLRGAA